MRNYFIYATMGRNSGFYFRLLSVTRGEFSDFWRNRSMSQILSIIRQRFIYWHWSQNRCLNGNYTLQHVGWNDLCWVRFGQYYNVLLGTPGFPTFARCFSNVYCQTATFYTWQVHLKHYRLMRFTLFIRIIFIVVELYLFVTHSMKIYNRFQCGWTAFHGNARCTITIRFVYEYATLHLLHATPYARTLCCIYDSKRGSRIKITPFPWNLEEN